jgi:Uncharacterized protein containing a von Willebrand factor type A (vWA) domain
METGLISDNSRIFLKSVSFRGNIHENFGDFVVEQEYANNNNDRLLEVKYVFPLDSSCCITDVKMIIGDVKLTSTLKPKAEARQNYKIGIENKYKSLLLEKSDKNYFVKIGNIEPYEKIKIVYSYFQEMKYFDNKYMCIIPTNIAPHYSSNISSNRGKMIKYSDKSNTKLSIDIKWFGNILYFATLTHKNEAKILPGEDAYYLSLDTIGLTHDFNLCCITENIINCINYTDGKDIYGFYYIKMRDIESKYVPENCTYYFLIDCSGSMSGMKISQAIDSLKLFFNSLDEGCLFNIYMFGTEFKKMYTEDKIYTEKTKAETLENINNIKANLGGTELLKPIRSILSMINKTNVNIFVLTDGQVDNRESIVNHIKKNRKSNFRIFTIDFGRDADRNLCSELALAACGRSDMCIDIDTKELKKTLINHLSLSRKDYYYDVQLHLDEHATILKDPYAMPNTVYKILTKMKANKEPKKAKITYINSSTREVGFHTLTCNVSKNNEVVKKMFVRSMIDSLEKGNIHHGYDIVNLSINNNILSSKTSFVLVDNAHKVNVDLPLVTKQVSHFKSLAEDYKSQSTPLMSSNLWGFSSDFTSSHSIPVPFFNNGGFDTINTQESSSATSQCDTFESTTTPSYYNYDFIHSHSSGSFDYSSSSQSDFNFGSNYGSFDYYSRGSDYSSGSNYAGFDFGSSGSVSGYENFSSTTQSNCSSNYGGFDFGSSSSGSDYEDFSSTTQSNCSSNYGGFDFGGSVSGNFSSSTQTNPTSDHSDFRFESSVSENFSFSTQTNPTSNHNDFNFGSSSSTTQPNPVPTSNYESFNFGHSSSNFEPFSNSASYNFGFGTPSQSISTPITNHTFSFSTQSSSSSSDINFGNNNDSSKPNSYKQNKGRRRKGIDNDGDELMGNNKESKRSSTFNKFYFTWEKNPRSNKILRRINDDISQYQNFNGSFKCVDEVFKIIGKTKQQITNLAIKNNKTFESQLHELIRDYLSNKPEYKFILNKLNIYLSVKFSINL